MGRKGLCWRNNPFYFSLWKNWRDAWFKQIYFLYSFIKLEETKPYKNILFNSIRNYTHFRSDICCVCVQRGDIPCLRNMMMITYFTSVFCSEARESALHAECQVEGGVFSHQRKVGTGELNVHSSKGTCSNFLFCTTFKALSITLGLFLPMQRLMPLL